MIGTLAPERTTVPGKTGLRGFAARLGQPAWPTTLQDRDTVLARLGSPPFLEENPADHHRSRHRVGLSLVLDWLEEQPGDSWQQRWEAGSGETTGPQWRAIPTAWMTARGDDVAWRQEAFFRSVVTAVSADVIRPSLTWLVSTTFRRAVLAKEMERVRDPAGFQRLRELCAAESGVPRTATSRTAYRAALILAAKGGTLGEITVGDVMEFLAAEAAAHGTSVGSTHLFYKVLRTVGGFEPGAPATLRELRAGHQRTPEEMIDRYAVACRPIRDLLIDYLRERQPALDYTSLERLSDFLGRMFWADLERHHPGIDSLHLPVEVADAWKQRLRTIERTTRHPDGTTSRTSTARVNYRECLTPVRAFYLDLAHWAVEDPARWGPFVTPCPVGSEEVDRRKDKHHRKSRMDARTRERLPVLPILVRTVDQRRRSAAALLRAARQAEPDAAFTAEGHALIRLAPARSAPTKVWALDKSTGARRDLVREDEYAFWAWAAVEVLRTTGIRIEELTELSHHSLVQYRLPGTGELVPLLQIAPSKTDRERLIVVSPELAEVLSNVIARIRAPHGAVPLIAAYDAKERRWLPPAPLLFQRPVGSEDRAIPAALIRDMLTAALEHTGLKDPATGEPLHFTPHDFRRLFITDAILSGLPPHIAQVIAGHQDINVTLGYKAVYPEEAIQAHLAFLARRRALRPSEEYRTPTDEEWTEFLGHFERRKVATGTCGRAFGTPCIHEHSCLRCPLHWPDPAQRTRIAEIRDNLIARIDEAEREGWLGEVEGLKVSLAGAEEKLTQIDQHGPSDGPITLGMPRIAPAPPKTGGAPRHAQ